MARTYPTGTFDGLDFNDKILCEKKPEEISDFWVTARGENAPSSLKGVAHYSEEELVKFVVDFCDGLLLTSNNVPADAMMMVFLPAALGAFSGWSKEAIDTIGILYEYHSEAGPRSINGRPCFTSMRVMHKDDWDRARVAIAREMALRNGTTARVKEDLDVDSGVRSPSDREHARPTAERGGDDPRPGGDVEREPDGLDRRLDP